MLQGLFAPDKNWWGEVHWGLSVTQWLHWLVVIAGVVHMLTVKTKDAPATDANTKDTSATARASGGGNA